MDKQDNTLSGKNPLTTSHAIDSLTLINQLPDVEPTSASRVATLSAFVHRPQLNPVSTGNLTTSHQYVATQQIHSQPIAHVEHGYAVPQSGRRQTWQVNPPIASFTGRESELGQFDDRGELMVDGSIHQMMSRKTPGITFSVLSQMNTLSGLGGVGKTQTARMYAHCYAKYYDHHAIEINAENASTLSDSFRKAARKLHLLTADAQGKPQAIAHIILSVYHYFAETLHQHCLFIFDNAASYEEIKDYLPATLSPQSIKPHLLITSRNRNWHRHLSTIQVLPLDVWPAEEATRFVKSQLGLSDGSQDEAIEQLIGNQCLQYLPLALHQAVVYIREEQKRRREFSIRDYLAKWSDAKEQLLSFTCGGSDNSYQQTVLTTWRVTLDKRKGQPGGKLALLLASNELSERDRVFLRRVSPNQAVLFYPDGKRILYSLPIELAKQMVGLGRAKVKSRVPYYITHCDNLVSNK